MRNPNGYGSVKKLKGNRRKPFMAVVTVGYEKEPRPDLRPLRDVLTPGTMAAVEREVDEHFSGLPSYRQKIAVIGYYETRAEALVALAEYNKSPYPLAGSDATVADIWEAVVSEHTAGWSASTRRGYASTWKKLAPIYDVKIRALKKAQMQSIVDSCSGMSRATQETIIKMFHFICGYALENDLIEKDYSHYVSIRSAAEPKKKHPFTFEEISAMLADPERFGVLLILIYTGLRISEFLALRPEDVHLDRRVMEVHGTKTKNADRVVPLHRDIAGLVLPSLLTGTTYGSYVFQFKRLMEEMGWEHTLHETRHTFATLAQTSGLDPYYIKRILGHESGDLTKDVYTHVYEARLIREIDKFDITGGGVIQFSGELKRA